MPVQKKTSSSAQSSAKKSPSKKMPFSKNKAMHKAAAVQDKTPVSKSATTKSSAKKSTAKNVAAKKPTAKKKLGKGKISTSELLEAIKAVEIETQESTDLAQPAEIASSDQTSTKSKGKAKKPDPLPIVPPMQKALEIVAPSASGKKKIRKTSFGKRDLDAFREELLLMRSHFTQQTKAMMHDALQREDGVTSEEDGTDAFMRLQVLNQMGSQQRAIADIDEALNDIATGAYGICEMCECLISKLRLKARPFARFCIKCKSEMERADRFNKPR